MNFFSKLSATSVVAVLITIFGFLGLAYIMYKFGDDATTRTQVVTGILGLLYIPAQYFFGSSKQRGLTQQAETITNTPSPTDNRPIGNTDNVEQEK